MQPGDKKEGRLVYTKATKDSAGLRYDPDILDLADVGVRTAQLCCRTFSRASSSYLSPLHSAPGRSAGPAARARAAALYARARIKGTACAKAASAERWCTTRIIFQRHTRYDAAESESRQIVQFNAASHPLLPLSRGKAGGRPAISPD